MRVRKMTLWNFRGIEEMILEFSLNGLEDVKTLRTIYSSDNQIDNDINNTLNLNLQGLCNNRKAVLDGAINILRTRRPNGAWTRAFLEKEIDAWQERGRDGKFHEYFQVVVYHLERKLA